MSDQVSSVPAGWYPDPSDATRRRYWDGAAWTAHVHPPVATAPADLRAPEGTRWSTPWIWLIVFLPLLSLVSLLLVPLDGIVESSFAEPENAMQAQLELYGSPGYLLSIATGWILTALLVFFAVLDYRALRAAGIPKPLHWAWGFFALLAPPIYPIARAVIVRRRTGRGFAVLWATIAVFVVTSIVTIVYVVGAISLVFDAALLEVGNLGAPDLH